MSYKELIAIPYVVDKLKFPPKSDNNLGPSKGTWGKFHKAFGHDVRNCITLGYQLADLVKNGFQKEYLEESQEGPTAVTPTEN